MIAAGTGAKLASEAFKSFHDVGTRMAGEKLGAALGTKLGESASQFISPTAQLVGAGLVAGAENVLSPLLTRGQPKTADYARQPFVPGTLPLTNEQAGYLYLDQMKLQNQLALLQARQNLTGGGGGAVAAPYGAAGADPYSSLSRSINTTYSY